MYHAVYWAIKSRCAIKTSVLKPFLWFNNKSTRKENSYISVFLWRASLPNSELEKNRLIIPFFMQHSDYLCGLLGSKCPFLMMIRHIYTRLFSQKNWIVSPLFFQLRSSIGYGWMSWQDQFEIQLVLANSLVNKLIENWCWLIVCSFQISQHWLRETERNVIHGSLLIYFHSS